MLKEILRSFSLTGPGRTRIYQGVAFILILRSIQLGMGLVATYFLARAMSKDAFGEYNMILNVVGVLTIFSLSGLNNSLVQAVARGYAGTYRTAVPIAFGSSLLGSIILLAYAIWSLLQGQLQVGYGLLAASILFPFAHGLAQWKSVATGNSEFGLLLIHDGVGSVLTYSLIIVSIVLMPGQYVYPIVLTLLVPAIYNIILTIGKFRQIPAGAPVEMQNVRYGIQTTLYSGLGAIGTNIDRTLLFWFLSPAALAIFVAASRIPDLLSGAMQDVAAVLAPRLAKHETYTKRIDRIFSALSVVYGLAVVIFAFTAIPFVVPILFGDKYADAIPYAQALTCSASIGTLSSLRFRYIRSKIDTRSFRDVTLFSSAVRLASFLLLVPPYGLLGAVLSTFIYRFALMSVIRVVIKRHYVAATKTIPSG